MTMFQKLNKIKFWLPLLIIVIFIASFMFSNKTAQNLIYPSANIKSDNDRTNFLLLGMGGENHEGGKLTDSIIVISISSKPADIYLLSLPRDIYLEEKQTKINALYELNGLSEISTAVSKITGLPIHYATIINFNAFIQAVDLVGGIDVLVENSFEDAMYPIAGKENDLCGQDYTFSCRYETIKFEKGINHMDGKTALKFVRSRHSLGDEGTDFARTKRQQLVLSALKQKYLQIGNVFSVSKFQSIYKIFSENIISNIANNEISGLIDLGIKNRDSKNKAITIPEDYFTNPPIDYRGWILLPTIKDFSQVKATISAQLK